MSEKKYYFFLGAALRFGAAFLGAALRFAGARLAAFLGAALRAGLRFAVAI